VKEGRGAEVKGKGMGKMGEETVGAEGRRGERRQSTYGRMVEGKEGWYVRGRREGKEGVKQKEERKRGVKGAERLRNNIAQRVKFVTRYLPQRFRG